jgi:hypothetical protein
MRLPPTGNSLKINTYSSKGLWWYLALPTKLKLVHEASLRIPTVYVIGLCKRVGKDAGGWIECVGNSARDQELVVGQIKGVEMKITATIGSAVSQNQFQRRDARYCMLVSWQVAEV